MRKAGLILLVVSLLVMVSCSERPGNVLSKNEMIDVLYDLQLAQAMHDDYNIELAKTKEGKEAIMNSVLLKYNLSRADLDSSIVWYSDNLSEYKAINDSVTAKLRKQVDILREEDNILRGINTDNTNTLPFYFYLDRSNTRKIFSFRESDMSDKGGLKNFRLSFKVIGLNGIDRNIETGVYFVYKDTTIVNKLTLTADSSYVVVKPDIPDSLLTQIQGFFRLPRISTLMPMKVYDVSYARDSLSLEADIVDSEGLQMLKADEKELKSAK